jgi:hypothetical protein
VTIDSKFEVHYGQDYSFIKYYKSKGWAKKFAKKKRGIIITRTPWTNNGKGRILGDYMSNEDKRS